MEPDTQNQKPSEEQNSPPLYNPPQPTNQHETLTPGHVVSPTSLGGEDFVTRATPDANPPMHVANDSGTHIPSSEPPVPSEPTASDLTATPVSTHSQAHASLPIEAPSTTPVSPVPAVAPAVVHPHAVVMGGQGSTTPSGPVVGAPGDTPPTHPAMGGITPALEPPRPARRRKKALMIGAALSCLLIGSAAAFYFGYYTNPSVIYSQALSNTGKGYGSLINYADAQSKVQYKGAEGSGSFSYKSSSFSTDGSLTFKSDGSTGEFSFDVGDGIGRLAADIRSFKSTTGTPDLYLKASGLQGLTTLLGSTGSPQLDSAINKLDNSWIVIDHTTIDNLQNQVSAAAGSASTAMTGPSKDDVLDELRALGKVNQQYLFSTDKNKGVTTIVKKYGVENTGGHKAYHYKVGLVKANVKKYITAQKDALNASKLGSWLKKNNYDTAVNSSFDAMQQGADTIKPSDTFEVWADTGKRAIYKLRFSDPANNPVENYVDVGLDYKGGDNYPFFISGQSKSGSQTTTGSLITTLNTKANSVDIKLNLQSGDSSGGTLSGDFSFKPSNATVQVAKPTGAQSLAQVLDELGLSSLLNTYLQAVPNVPTGSSSSLFNTQLN